MNEALAFDHVHLLSRDAKAAANWYQEMFGGEISAVQEDLRGAPQIDVRVGGVTIVIRGRRPGDFGFTYRGDLMAFCEQLKNKGVRMAVEPWEFKPGMVLCYVAAPDGVSIELIQAPGQ